MKIKKIIKVGSLIFILLYIVLPCMLYIILSNPYRTREEKRLKPVLRAALKNVNVFKVSAVSIDSEDNSVTISIKFRKDNNYNYTEKNLAYMNKVTEQLVNYLNSKNGIHKYGYICIYFKYDSSTTGIRCGVYLEGDKYSFDFVYAKYCHRLQDFYIMKNVDTIELEYYPYDCTKEELEKLTTMKKLKKIVLRTNSYNNELQQFADWIHEYMPECKVTCKDGEVGANGIISYEE